MLGSWLMVVVLFLGWPSAGRGEEKIADESAQTLADKTQPVLEVDKDRHSFGAYWIDEPAKYDFKLTNAGNATLIIQRVTKGCGSCTAVGKYKKELAPGESTVLPVSMINRRLNGQYRKRVTIYSNDPQRPKYSLTLVGDCKWRVGAEPERAYFGLLLDNKPRTKTIRLVNHSDQELKLSLGPQAHPERVKLELKETQPGQEYELKITMKPPFKPGYIRDNLLIYTNLDTQKKIIIPVYAKIPHRLEVVPRQLIFSEHTMHAKSDDETQRRILRVSNYGAQPVKVLDAETNDPAIELKVIERKPGKEYTIYLQMPSDYMPPTKGRMLTIKTDDKQKPVIKVPIRRPHSVSRNRPSTNNLLGKPAPAFALKSLDGRMVSKKDLADMPAVINVIAINCPFCKKQVPQIEQVRRDYADKGVKFITIVERKGKVYNDQQVKNVLDDLGMEGTLVNDRVNLFSKAYKVRSLPTLIVLGKDDKIEAVTVGAKKNLEKQLRAQLDRLIQEKTVKKADASTPAK